MKKIILNESQLKKILNENPIAKIQTLVKNSQELKQGEGTLSGSALSTMSDELYDAIKGGGTNLESIKSTFTKCVNFHDVVIYSKSLNNVRVKTY